MIRRAERAWRIGSALERRANVGKISEPLDGLLWHAEIGERNTDARRARKRFDSAQHILLDCELRPGVTLGAPAAGK